MGCVIRRKYRDRDGKLRKLPRYYIRYVDANGKPRTEPAYRDLQASKALLAMRETQAARGEVGRRDPYGEHRSRPLTEHVEAFVTHLAANGAGAAHVKHVRQHLDRAFKSIGASHVADVTTGVIEGHLLRLLSGHEPGRDGREGKPRGFKTRNHVLASLREFFAWGVRDGRWPENPAESIKPLNAEADPKRRRRPATVDELLAVVESARVRPRAKYLEAHPEAPAAKLMELELHGQERATIYLTAGLTGLRRGELRQLRWADLHLDGESPTVSVRAETTKAKREDTLALAANVAQALREWRETWTRLYWRVPGVGDPVFPGVTHGLLEAFRHDLAYAGVDEETPEGRLDFHSLRHTACTLLCRAGVSVRTAQAMMRHVDPRTTMKVYAHVQAADRLDAARRLAELTTPAAKKAATGTGACRPLS
ncbi:MAG: site-specific integrase [Planctomycetes bacterium]|nr:site-specific integrase [Planctomycetota bacterium]